MTGSTLFRKSISVSPAPGEETLRGPCSGPALCVVPCRRAAVCRSELLRGGPVVRRGGRGLSHRLRGLSPLLAKRRQGKQPRRQRYQAHQTDTQQREFVGEVHNSGREARLCDEAPHGEYPFPL